MMPVIVGELNPFGGDEYYALFPEPRGCTGDRLCRLILGMTQDDYLAAFARTNLCSGKWSIKEARIKAKHLWANPGRFILLGAKVCKAWEAPFVPFEVADGDTRLTLPHPSGLNRFWQTPGAIQRARDAVKAFLSDKPEIVALMGCEGL